MAKRHFQQKIPPSAANEEASADARLLEFSFKHLDCSSPKFDIETCDKDYLCALLRRIQVYSNYSVEQFTNFNHLSDRNTIDPDKLRKQLANKKLDEQLLDSEAWEFRVDPETTIPPRSLWRAHGLRIGNVFYLVWLDPRHQLFESKHPRHKRASGKK